MLSNKNIPITSTSKLTDFFTMNNEFDYEYNNFDELYDSMMETNPEDWLPDAGVREQLDSETLALLKNF
jgi:hypothetical protein